MVSLSRTVNAIDVLPTTNGQVLGASSVHVATESGRYRVPGFDTEPHHLTTDQSRALTNPNTPSSRSYPTVSNKTAHSPPHPFLHLYYNLSRDQSPPTTTQGRYACSAHTNACPRLWSGTGRRGGPRDWSPELRREGLLRLVGVCLLSRGG